MQRTLFSEMLVACLMFIFILHGKSQSVFCHYMMGNSYDSNKDTFTNDINLASQVGIDGFALNIGPDDWMPDRISQMYDAVMAFPNFKLFFSFDMAVISDVNTLLNYVRQYHTHPNAFIYQDKYFVSTFAGESQTFGQNDVNQGWQTQFKDPLANEGINIYFVPSWTALGPNQIFENNPVLDGMFSWAAWPTTNADLGLDEDNLYMDDAKRNGKTYMAGVSPWFFTHFDYKNWIYKSETLWPQRWEDMLTLKPDFIEIISWNDFGESHYLGPVGGAMPAGSEAWVNGYDHQAWLEIASYFITAYKTGNKPEIQKDQVFFWYRTSSKDAQMSDPLPRPDNADWAEDNIIAYSILTAPAQIVITSGGTPVTFDAAEGTQLIETPFQEGKVIVELYRNGQQLAILEGGLEVKNSGSLYNFNSWVGKMEYAAITTTPPQATNPKVFCHYMMGNSYDSNKDTFTNDINLASEAGIDGFALNIGPDDWMPDRISQMHDAATAFPDFKLFFSFDIAVINDVNSLLNYVRQYHTHPNAFIYQDKYFVSTFAGESQFWGQADLNTGWQTQFKDPLANEGINIYFVPSWTALGPNQIFENNPVMDGMFSWAAWPTTNADLGLDEDNLYMDDAKRNGKTYMAGVSPWFFTHFDYKNWIYKSETLWPQRWEDMLTLKPDFIEIISWNDFGESHYLGPVGGAMPAGSEAWVDGYDHQAWLEIASYFISAYKNDGVRPAIEKDQVFFWYRTSSKNAEMSDPLPKPMNSDWAEDNIVVYSMLTAPAQVVITSGDSQVTFDAAEGTQLIETAFQEGKVIVELYRNGQQLASQEGGLDIKNSGNLYNFNSWVGKLEFSPASRLLKTENLNKNTSSRFRRN